jgi:hypothetical protein
MSVRAVLGRLASRITLAALLGVPTSSYAQSIVGLVTDDLTGAPIPLTTVLLVDSTDTAVSWTVSGADGRFRLTAPGAGAYRLFASRLAYERIISPQLQVQEPGSLEVELRLKPRPLALDSLTVTVRARPAQLEANGFYRRRDASGGNFFDVTDLEKWRPLRISDLLRQVPAVMVRPTNSGGAVILSRRANQPRGCPIEGGAGWGEVGPGP